MNTFIRWGKFSLVGAMGMAVQLAALTLFNRWTAGHYLYASAAAIELTLVHNFISPKRSGIKHEMLRCWQRNARPCQSAWPRCQNSNLRHYGKWAKGRQANIDRLMFAHFETASLAGPVTNSSHEKVEPVN